MNEELNNILAKVHELYQRYGIKSVTMDDVAHEMGISKKTLYKHVCDKTDLVEKIFSRQLELQQKEFTRIHQEGENAIHELMLVQQWIMQHLKEHNPAIEYDLRKYYPALFETLLNHKRKQMHDSVLENLQRGKKEGIYLRGLPVEIITKLLIFWVESMYSNNIFTPEEIVSPVFHREIFGYHLRAIVNDEGRKLLHQYTENNQFNISSSNHIK